MSLLSSLSPDLQTALLGLVRQQLPPGQPVTLDTAEAAVVQLLRQLGPDLLSTTLQQEIEGSDSPAPTRGKRGHRPSVPAER
jgi:hypothetical protein